MRSALNQLVLLGFICQALSWSGWFLPLANVALWLVCVRIGERRPVLLPGWAESALLGLGSVGGILIGQLPDQSPHFFIGHGITLFQAGRLLRSLDRREKLFSLIAATVQLGVACTVVLDYRFIPILVVTAILIPKTLMELEGEHFPDTAAAPRPRFNWAGQVAVFAVMILFFATFPRGLLSSAFPPLRSGPDNGSLLDSTLDASRGSGPTASRVILQIKGENLGYMRLFALTTFDGVRWLPDSLPGQNYSRFLPPEERVGLPHRVVRVKEVRNLGRHLPTDGRIVALEGRFFAEPRRTFHEFIACRSIWNTANNVYEYWLDPKPDPQGLGRRYGRSLLNHPRQSARLQAWLDEELAGIDSPLEQARHLENFFLENFEYELGAPVLNRLNPVEDFILNDRRGHCERYASAMALLLRMKGIPSRVMLGYVPGKPNWLTSWVNVRATDAHAWAEGWFPGIGWVWFDATPRAEMDLSIPPWRELLDALDVVWYVNIVNFDATAQEGLFTSGVAVLVASAGWARSNPQWPGGILALLALFLIRRSLRGRVACPDRAAKARRKRRVLAEHYYGKLLKILARRGIDRDPHQTPLEFLATLDGRGCPALPDVRRVTDRFCAMRYGDAALSEEDRREIEAALDRIARADA